MRSIFAGVKVSTGWRGVTLELSTPNTAKVEVCFSIFVNERCGVDREGFGDGFGIGSEWTLGLVGNGYTDLEDTCVCELIV